MELAENKKSRLKNQQYYMKLAIMQAKKAGQINEVPIGSLIVAESGEVISAACNKTIFHMDPTAHAEVLAIRQAAETINNYRLTGATLYTTIEPCIMCMGAILHARLKRVVFGAHDPKWGGAGSLYSFAEDSRLNHRVEIISGVCADECRLLMQNFFALKRKEKLRQRSLETDKDDGND